MNSMDVLTYKLQYGDPGEGKTRTDRTEAGQLGANVGVR